MNRYYWLAIFLSILAITSIAAIWILDLSNPVLEKRVELTLGIFTSLNALVAIISVFVGFQKKQIKDSKTNVPLVQASSSSKEMISDLLNKDDSVLQYFWLKKKLPRIIQGT